MFALRKISYVAILEPASSLENAKFCIKQNAEQQNIRNPHSQQRQLFLMK